MQEAQCGWLYRWGRRAGALVAAVGLVSVLGGPASAVIRYDALQLSGNVETYNIVRNPNGNTFEFIHNRNTARIRVDWDWIQKSKLANKLDIPFIDRSNVFLLYRGTYDSFYDFTPNGITGGQSAYDNRVGGPVDGNSPGSLASNGGLKGGSYTRWNQNDRNNLKINSELREAYIDAKFKNVPVSVRIGRQQVIWGEADQNRLMDMWNPLDLTWHLQQEKSWDELRVPLWLMKGLWDIGMVGPLSNSFMEVVYNPGDFQVNQKLDFLPNPWSAWFPKPTRQGQVQQLTPGQYLTPDFNLEGSSYRHGVFNRNPADASEIGTRFHAVTPFGLEFTTNYMYGRARQLGAGNALGVHFDQIGRPIRCGPGTTQPQCYQFALDGKAYNVLRLPINAQIEYPYEHIFGLTGNYFESDYTQAVFRLETAYEMGAPVQSKYGPDLQLPPGNFANPPLQMEKTDIWAGMIGIDRPTWIKFLNPKATWFLTGQAFWSYYTGPVTRWAGNSGVGQTPYFTPPTGQPGHNSNGFGQWVTGPYAGLTERLQLNGNPNGPSGDNLRRWEHLITFAAFSFYRGGTVVPMVANAWDPVNGNNESLWYLDYFITNNLILTLQQKYFWIYAGSRYSNDPWGAGGRNANRDESGAKLVWQF